MDSLLTAKLEFERAKQESERAKQECAMAERQYYVNKTLAAWRDQLDKFWGSFEMRLDKQQSLRKRFGNEMTEDEVKEEYENAQVDFQKLKVKLQSLQSKENDAFGLVSS